MFSYKENNSVCGESYGAWIAYAIEVTIIVMLVSGLLNIAVFRTQIKDAVKLLKR